MKCPACSNQLKTLSTEAVEVEACDGGCGGIWFDPTELEHFDEPHEFNASPFKAIKHSSPSHVKDRQRNCPRCDGQVMAQLFVDPFNFIRIDQCFGCGGIWFDAGELKNLADQFKTAEDRKRAIESYADSCLANHKDVIRQAGQNRAAKFHLATENYLKGFLYFFQHLV